MDEETCLVRYGWMLVNKIMTHTAERHQVRHAEGNVFVGGAAHPFRAAVMNVSGRLETAEAILPVPRKHNLARPLPLHPIVSSSGRGYA